VIGAELSLKKLQYEEQALQNNWSNCRKLLPHIQSFLTADKHGAIGLNIFFALFCVTLYFADCGAMLLFVPVR
jgi:hypothetical protein